MPSRHRVCGRRKRACRRTDPPPASSQSTDAEDSAAEASGEGEPLFLRNPLMFSNQQVSREGSFRHEQKEDDWLKHCQVLLVDKTPSQPQQPLTVAYILIWNSLIYHWETCGLENLTQEEPVICLSSPEENRVGDTSSSCHPLGVHLRACNMLEKPQDCFHSPGMVTKVRCFCQQCPQCQCTTPCTLAPALLIPLLIIGMPFK